MSRRNAIPTVKVPLTLDMATNRILEQLASIGVFGKNKAEVAAGILRTWIWDNEEKLGRQGVALVSNAKWKVR